MFKGFHLFARIRFGFGLGLRFGLRFRLGLGLGLCALITGSTGCALRFETVGGDSWSMGISRHRLEMISLNRETALVREDSQAAPLELAVVPIGIEATLGWQQQARGVVVPHSITNRFLPPSGPAFATRNGWYLGFIHYRIPRDENRVRLLASTVGGGAVRVAHDQSHLRIGVSKTTATTVLHENIQGEVEYGFRSPGYAPCFRYSVRPRNSAVNYIVPVAADVSLPTTAPGTPETTTLEPGAESSRLPLLEQTVNTP